MTTLPHVPGRQAERFADIPLRQDQPLRTYVRERYGRKTARATARSRAQDGWSAGPRGRLGEPLGWVSLTVVLFDARNRRDGARVSQARSSTGRARPHGVAARERVRRGTCIAVPAVDADGDIERDE